MKILVLGAAGQVGTEIVDYFCRFSSYEMIVHTRQHCDLRDNAALMDYLTYSAADLIINAAAYTAVDKAEEEAIIAEHINALCAASLAEYCQQQSIPLLHLSTDYVFDGKKTSGYREEDATNPLSVYGASKLAGEQLIAAMTKKHLILRVSWVFGRKGSNFVKSILKLAANRAELAIVNDQYGKPTAAKDIARVLFTMVEKITQEPDFADWGIYHYASEEQTNWYDFAHTFINMAKQQGYCLTLQTLKAISTNEYPTKAKRPANSILLTPKIERIFNIHCHHWKDYLPEVIAEVMKKEESYGLPI